MSEHDEAEFAALHTGATLLATTAATALVGPEAGIFAGMASESVMAWFNAQARGNDEGLRAARIGALEDEVRKLAARLRKLEEQATLEHDDALSREQVFSEFARDVAQAQTSAKRDALVNAAANRFNSSVAGQATRKFWYDVLREMSEIQVFTFQLVADNEPITFIGNDLVAFGIANPRAVDMKGEDIETVRATLNELTEAGSDTKTLARRTVISTSAQGGRAMIEYKSAKHTISQSYVPSPGGRVLAKLIAN